MSELQRKGKEADVISSEINSLEEAIYAINYRWQLLAPLEKFTYQGRRKKR